MNMKNQASQYGGYLIFDVLILENSDPVCRQRIRKRIWPVVALLLHCPEYLLPGSSILVHKLCILLKSWHTNPVVRSCNRCKITYKKKIVTLGRRLSHKAENTSVGIVCINPFKSLRIIICGMNGRILPVNIQQILNKALQIPVLLFLK